MKGRRRRVEPRRAIGLVVGEPRCGAGRSEEPLDPARVGARGLEPRRLGLPDLLDGAAGEELLGGREERFDLIGPVPSALPRELAKRRGLAKRRCAARNRDRGEKGDEESQGPGAAAWRNALLASSRLCLSTFWKRTIRRDSRTARPSSDRSRRRSPSRSAS